MYFYWIVLTLLVIASTLFSNLQHSEEVTSDAATVDSLSRSLLVYRSAAADYARSNPAVTGTPTTLSLPTWYNAQSGVTAYVIGGHAYTYYAGATPPGLPSALAKQSEAVTVGVNRAGILISPNSGTTGIVIPQAVPEGAVVVVN